MTRAEVIRELRRAYKILYKSGLTVEQAVGQLREMVAQTPAVGPLVEFIARSSRGIVR